MKILILDPDLNILQRLVKAFLNQPVEIQEECESHEAILVLRQMQPDVFVCPADSKVFSDAKRITQGRCVLIALTGEEPSRRCQGLVPWNRKVDATFPRNPLPIEDIAEACENLAYKTQLEPLML